ncbi:MAG: tetratricopeptide repeat protein [Acidobacteria bacterium]|nr:tetratricopeptide repeat protein [Acidobacteriota bacterium]
MRATLFGEPKSGKDSSTPSSPSQRRKAGILLFSTICLLVSSLDLHVAQENVIQRYYQEASQAFVRSDLARARELLVKILAMRADIPEIHSLLGAVYDRMGDQSQARKHFESAIKLKPDDPEIQSNVAMFLTKQGDVKGAIQLLERSLQSNAKDPELLLQVGRLYYLSDQFQKAVLALQRVEAIDPQRSKEFYLILALAFERLGKRDAAEEKLQRLLQISPNDNQALLELGKLYLTQGNSVKVVALLDSQAVRSSGDAQLHALFGEGLMASNDLERAISEYERACDLDNKAEQYRFNLAAVYFRNGQHARCIEAIERIPVEKRNAEILNLLASAYAKLGDSRKSREIYERAIGFSSTDEKPYYNLGLLLIREFAYQEAIETLNQATEKFPDSGDLLLALSAAHQLKGEYSMARKVIGRVIHLQPQSSEAHYYLAGSYLETGDTTAAKAAFDRAHELNPNDYRINYFLGWIAVKAGRIEEGSQFLTRSVELKPTFAFGHHQLARVYLQTGEFDKALGACHKAVEADPGLAQAYYVLAQVNSRMGRTEEAQKQLAIYQRVKATTADKEYRVFILP